MKQNEISVIDRRPAKKGWRADFGKNMQIWNTGRDAWKWKLDERWRSDRSEKWALVYSAVSERGILNEQVAAWRVEVEMKDSITTVGEDSVNKLLDLSVSSSQKYGKLDGLGNILCLEAEGRIFFLISRYKIILQIMFAL